MLRLAPRIAAAGLLGDGFRARVVGSLCQAIILGPVRQHSKHTGLRLQGRHRLVAYVGMGMPPHEHAAVARPYVGLGPESRRLDGPRAAKDCLL